MYVKGQAVDVTDNRGRVIRSGVVTTTYEDGATVGVRYNGGRNTNVIPTRFVQTKAHTRAANNVARMVNGL
jgi:hypothetical protein